jgi:hypothetical protein
MKGRRTGGSVPHRQPQRATHEEVGDKAAGANCAKAACMQGLVLAGTLPGHASPAPTGHDSMALSPIGLHNRSEGLSGHALNSEGASAILIRAHQPLSYHHLRDQILDSPPLPDETLGCRQHARRRDGLSPAAAQRGRDPDRDLPGLRHHADGRSRDMVQAGGLGERTAAKPPGGREHCVGGRGTRRGDFQHRLVGAGQPGRAHRGRWLGWTGHTQVA